jgi:hypothetical protein
MPLLTYVKDSFASNCIKLYYFLRFRWENTNYNCLKIKCSEKHLGLNAVS